MAKPKKGQKSGWVPTKLSDRDKQVLNFYYGISRLNKTDALRRAGWAHPNKGLQFYTRPAIKAEMERREAQDRERYEITHERIMDELARIAYSSIFDFAEITDDGQFILDEETLAKASMKEIAALGEVTVETYMEGKGEDARQVKRVKIKPWNKLSALGDLMRYGGLSKEKSQVGEMASLMERIIAAREQSGSGDANGE
jgi:phage terminase small subunit